MKIKSIVQDIFILAGFSAVVFGIYQIYPPASWIIAGGGVLWISFPNGKKNK